MAAVFWGHARLGRPFTGLENVNLRKDGRPVVLETSAVPVFDAEGRPRGYRGVDRDVTERKRAEQALRESEERYRRLYERTPVMMHSIHREGRLVSVSDHWLNQLGYAREEVIGRRSVEFLTEASRPYAREVVLPAFMESGYCRDVEYQFLRKDGTVMDALLSATAEAQPQLAWNLNMGSLYNVLEAARVNDFRVFFPSSQPIAITRVSHPASPRDKRDAPPRGGI